MKQNSLVIENMPLVHFFCRKYQNMGSSYNDLFSSACLGLVEASRRFDIEKGAFGSFAGMYIKMEIIKELRTNRLIPLPACKSNHIHTVSRATENLEQKLNRAPNIKELSESTGLPEKWISAIEHTPKIDSIDDSGDDKPPLSEVIHTEQFSAEVNIWEQIKPLISKKEFQLLWFFFVYGNDTSELATRYNRSRRWINMRISAICRKIKPKLTSNENLPIKIH